MAGNSNLPQILWRAFPVIRKTWGDHSIVFNTVSGNTHLVNPIAASILGFIQSRSLSADAISEKLAAEMDVAADDEILQQVKVVLRTLDGLGLVESLAR